MDRLTQEQVDDVLDLLIPDALNNIAGAINRLNNKQPLDAIDSLQRATMQLRKILNSESKPHWKKRIELMVTKEVKDQIK